MGSTGKGHPENTHTCPSSGHIGEVMATQTQAWGHLEKKLAEKHWAREKQFGIWTVASKINISLSFCSALQRLKSLQFALGTTNTDLNVRTFCYGYCPFPHIFSISGKKSGWDHTHILHK